MRMRMKTPEEVRRTLARVANMVINKEIDTKTANTIILAGNAILNAIRTDEQGRKLEELEKTFDELEQGLD